MKKVIRLGIKEIQYISDSNQHKRTCQISTKDGWVEVCDIEEKDELKNWSLKPDFDGSTIERMVDAFISNYVRVGFAVDSSEIILFEKNNLDKVINEMIDKKALTYRAAQRQQSDYVDDYLEFYSDLIEDTLEFIMPNISKNLYINSFDYVIERAIDEKYFQELLIGLLPEHDVQEALDRYYDSKREKAC